MFFQTETVQFPTLQETVENNAKTETHLAKKRISGTGRRGMQGKHSSMHSN